MMAQTQQTGYGSMQWPCRIALHEADERGFCVYTIFQLFAIYISRQSVASEQEEQSDTTDRGYWYQAAAGYATTGLTSALPALTGGNAVITDATGQQWQAMQIYQSMALIAISTMGFVALLSVFLIDKHQRSL
jgi:cytochrome c biogenesis protein CcdA